MRPNNRKQLERFAAALAVLLLVSSPSVWALTIALSDDDGWDAIGFQAAKRALAAAGHTVVLAGPLNEQSGSSAAINMTDLRITKRRDDEGALEYSVAIGDGTESAEPATSALVAIDIARQRTGRTPDLLVSGINIGANIGAATQFSGTVGAAIAALSSMLNGAVPAIAISTDPMCGESTPDCRAANEAHFARVADFLVAFIARLERKAGSLEGKKGLLPLGVGLNINYPPLPEPAGVLLTRQGRTVTFTDDLVVSFGADTVTVNIGCHEPCADVPVGTTVPGGITEIIPDDTPEIPNADTTWYAKGYITIVPITPDYTAGTPNPFPLK
ncbi:5'/3'-nucleotidase SurE [Methylobacter sp. YRD-M1]|uniref:5'/3'-nucleotidase SurE n=1 Tax=Methylobacter sp. YRD-M1 TaxID=2911520 RepID=UPI00227B942F|nr:5'/3'-nucleotidase SurE [Methylobacter sp. YRD-M1]WAK00335.1 5'/3'-nucleotidase SurE [Methylobacter sp. YRD-M1]